MEQAAITYTAKATSFSVTAWISLPGAGRPATGQSPTASTLNCYFSRQAGITLPLKSQKWWCADMSAFFKAPVNRENCAGFSKSFLWLTDLRFERADRLYAEAASGFPLFEFEELGQRVQILSSTFDAKGCIKVQEPKDA
jgi:hypothetical protein